MNILLEGDLPAAKEDVGVHEITINNDSCAFCNPKIVQRQFVYEWNGVYLLLTHKPFTPPTGFLILPKRHKVAWDLTESEVLAVFDLIKATSLLLKEKSDHKSLIFYVQDGPSAGQTVPHTHLHLLPIPSSLRTNVVVLQHLQNKRKVLSPQEMQAICQEYRAALKELLRE